MSAKSTWNPAEECPILMRLSGALSGMTPNAELHFGSATNPIPVTAGTYAFDWRFTSSSTSGTSSVVPFYVKQTMTGAAGVGGRSMFHLYTNVALGGWANAIKGYTEFGASGRVSGLGSAVCAEIALSAGTVSGSYAPLESELVLGTGAKTGAATSFLFLGVSGAAKGEFDDNGFLFEVAGLAISAGHLMEAETGAVASSHSLRIRIDGTTYYIPINTAQNFGSA